ncbi:MAG TPA: zinc ABC transporter substrate-binding protein [Micrococcaceae bacterium]|jgi:zinc/manganese transport system substrate-binding protein|nr:zinc ABC transporter substrate-binding protein [Micrococcaceae bacterium]
MPLLSSARRAALAIFSLLAGAVLLSACGAGPSSSAAAGSTTAEGKISVVASTDVYGSIAGAIGGSKVNVTSIIKGPSQDPHSYQATAQDKLTVSKAQLGIENGGGYDDFFDQLAGGGTLSADRIVNVVDLSGLQTPANKADFNEHVWYSLPTMTKLADALAERLTALDPADATAFRANAASFKSSISGIAGKLDAAKAEHSGDPVAITEPVPLYLLQAAGLENRTPEAYSHAIEEGSDVPAGVLKQTTDLVGGKGVRFLAYNDQTEGPQTETVRKAAEAAGVPVVNFTETLPDGLDYLGWMSQNANNIQQALAK